MIRNIITVIFLVFVLFSIAYADIETEPNNNMETSDILVSGTRLSSFFAGKYTTI